MATIISGKAVSQEVLARVSEQVAALKEKGTHACLAVIIVGDDPASKIYVGNKKAACEKVGIKSLEFAMPASTTEEELLAVIDKLNADDSVHGILCQLPLPKHLNEKTVINAIRREKDVDAFTAMVGADKTDMVPCTPAGCMELLKSAGVSVAGKHCVVIGRSNIVGKPMALLLLRNDATVTVCHSKTQDLASYTRDADVLIAAVGVAKFIKADMVKPGAAVIDVGMDRDENGKLCGDVDFENVKEVAGYITPVPGGVGPMTIAMLMQNTILAAERASAK
ncbi:MAG: bifunctional 5,10-methylene-tetrahydrofolate dehydrogenase/5,10-methylene-tetrahydrofolate cyclohydrolase [Clostridia bacterium]|nr:bifunctional 5,10-methylene-tetrahydrofolate dehydrogenase/5,10-methylene-tetrahydrofolate cyclohydrolase [Clostridia bacterium]